MKKIYSFILLQMGLFLMGTMPAAAQDEVTLQINGRTGTWTASGSPAYANEYATASQNPGVRIQHWNRSGGHNNNMYFYDGNNLGIYSAFGSTESEDYRIYPSAGWYVKAVSLDFVTGVHPNYSNPGGISVYVNGDDPVTSYGTNDLQHYEIDNLDPELEYATLTIAQVDKPAFAHTSNFTITLKKQDALVAAWAEFRAAYDKYTAYSEDDFPVGTEPGCYDETAVAAFFQAVADASDYNDTAGEDVTAEQLNAATKAMNDTYEAMIATKVAFTVENGYYRFRAAMEYNDGNPKYMACMPTTTEGTYVGYWYTPGDAEDNYINIWKITKSGENYDVQSVAFDARFTGPTAASGYAYLNKTSTELMAFDAVTSEYVNVRLASKDANNFFYLHQGGHGGGNGSAGYIVGWECTYASGSPAASEWVLEPVSESDVAQAKTEYEAFKVHQDLVNNYNNLFKTAASELPKAQDGVQGTALITSGEQFSSEWTETREGVGQSGEWDGLIDGVNTTYWHSDWSASVPNHTHWLQVDLSEATYSLVRMTITRRPVANDHITRWSVFGSDEPDAVEEDWTEVATLFTPFGTNTETVSGLVFDGKGYKHLRFYIDGTTTGRGYGHVSEFQLYAIDNLDGTPFASIGAAATALENTLIAQKDIKSDDLTENNYNDLKSAYDAFHAKFSDPTEMRELLLKAEELVAGIVAGDNPGQWSDMSAGDALKNTISTVKAYDEAANYDPSSTANYVSTLTSQMEAVKAAANPIKADTWYRIRFGTEDEFVAGGWDLVAGNGTENDEPLWGKYVYVAQYADGAHDDIDISDVRMGTNLYFFDNENIAEEDKALFRFIDCGDKGYLLQNKATGLFLKAAGTSGAVTLSIIPSFFTSSALGYGQNLIAAKDLEGNAQSYLHAQVAQNVLVTYNAFTLGSRSGLYLEEAGDASGFDGSEFAMDILPGRFYSFCYPVNLSATDGKMLTVASAQGTTINLTTISEAAAGQPFFYIFGETTEYNADGTTEGITFTHGIDIADEPHTEGAIKGTYASKNVGQGFVFIDTNNPTMFSVTRQLLGGTIPAYSAYIESSESLPYTADITVIIDGETVIDGVRDIEGTLKSVYTNGVIYTLGGQRIANGNLDTLRTLGRGIYIINGVKVAVK